MATGQQERGDTTAPVLNWPRPRAWMVAAIDAGYSGAVAGLIAVLVSFPISAFFDFKLDNAGAWGLFLFLAILSVGLHNEAFERLFISDAKSAKFDWKGMLRQSGAGGLLLGLLYGGLGIGFGLGVLLLVESVVVVPAPMEATFMFVVIGSIPIEDTLARLIVQRARKSR